MCRRLKLIMYLCLNLLQGDSGGPMQINGTRAGNMEVIGKNLNFFFILISFIGVKSLFFFKFLENVETPQLESVVLNFNRQFASSGRILSILVKIDRV